MKGKRIVKLVFMLLIVLVLGLFVVKENFAADFIKGSISYNTVESASGTNETIEAGKKVGVNNTIYTTVFKNANVYCVQKGTSLRGYESDFTIGSEIKINKDSDPTLKGFAYLLSFSPSSVTNPNVEGTANPIQKVVWRYIYELEKLGKASVLQNTLGFSYIEGASESSYPLYDDYWKIYNMAIEIANGNDFGITNMVNEVRNFNESPSNTISLSNNGVISYSVPNNNGSIQLTGKETITDGGKSVENFWYFDLDKISATIYKFSGGARQGLIIVKDATRGINNITLQPKDESTGSFSLQKYIVRVEDSEGKVVYESDARRNRLPFSSITADDLKKGSDLLNISANLTSSSTRFKPSKTLSEIWKFPESINAANARYMIRVPSTTISSTITTDITKTPKREDPVIVSDGDIVTYDIEVYYNKENPDDIVPDKLALKDVVDRYNISNSEIKSIQVIDPNGANFTYTIAGQSYYLVQNFLTISTPYNQIIKVSNNKYNEIKSRIVGDGRNSSYRWIWDIYI